MTPETTFGSRQLPRSWSAKRLKYAVSLINEKASSEETDLQLFGLEHVESWTGRLLEAPQDAGSEDVQTNNGVGTRFRSGDVLFGKLRPYLAKVHRADREGICSGELLVLRPSDFDSRFLNYSLLTPEFISVVDSSTYGAKMPRANWAFIGNLRLPIPPREEQEAIADFLDRETARIDGLIARKQRFVSLIEEEANSEITTVLTGKNQKKARQIEVQWIGCVPMHWEVLPIGRIAEKIETGPFGSQLHAEDYEAGGVPVINPAHLQEGKIVEDERSAVSVATAARLSRHQLRYGDLIVARRGEVGRCAIVSTREVGWLCGTGSMKVRLKAGHCPEYFNLLMGAAGPLDQLLLASVGSTMPNINPTILARLLVPVPPGQEQSEIVTEVASIRNRANKLKMQVKAGIDSLRKYRSALISATVTGQIDVRNYRAQGVAACP